LKLRKDRESEKRDLENFEGKRKGYRKDIANIKGTSSALVKARRRDQRATSAT
jgi:hypothetical protein